MIDPEMMLFLMDKAVGTYLEVAGGWVLHSCSSSSIKLPFIK